MPFGSVLVVVATVGEELRGKSQQEKRLEVHGRRAEEGRTRVKQNREGWMEGGLDSAALDSKISMCMYFELPILRVPSVPYPGCFVACPRRKSHSHGDPT